MWFRRALAVAASAPLLAFPAPVHGDAPPPMTAQQIFDAAFRRLQSYPVPPYAVWTSTWRITQRPMGYYTGETKSVEFSRYALRLSDGMENVSDGSASGKLPPAIIEPEFIGPFAWTIRSSVRVAPAQSVAMSPDISGLMTIARVVAVAQWPYALARTAALPPIEQIDGRLAYHFQLKPREEPQRHNLRDLWIDAITYDVRRVRFVGTYRPVPQAPVSATEATVDLREVLGCWVVTRSQWTYDDEPMHYEFDVLNNEIGLPATLPDWLFNTEEYRKHEAAGEPDYVGQLLERLRKGNGSPKVRSRAPQARAIQSISIRAPRGSAATATVLRAGFDMPKYFS